jgi:hypothetical protein
MVAVALHGGVEGHTPTLEKALNASDENLKTAGETADKSKPRASAEATVDDKRHHGTRAIGDLALAGSPSYISQPMPKRQDCKGEAIESDALYATRRRKRNARGHRLMLRRAMVPDRRRYKSKPMVQNWGERALVSAVRSTRIREWLSDGRDGGRGSGSRRRRRWAVQSQGFAGPAIVIGFEHLGAPVMTAMRHPHPCVRISHHLPSRLVGRWSGRRLVWPTDESIVLRQCLAGAVDRSIA